MSVELIRIEEFALIRINRPEALNAFSIALLRDLGRAFDEAAGLARRAVRRALDTPLHEGLKIEADLSTLACQTADAAEGMAAFLEKRKPRLKDE